MSQIEEGGTKLQRRIPPPQQQVQQSTRVPPQVSPQQQSQNQYYNQQQHPQQVISEPPPPTAVKEQQTPGTYYTPPPQNDQRQQENFKPPKKISTFSEQSKEVNFKYAILVSLLFILLNSKMVWRQIIKLPLMGSVEPSILALIVNSVLTGLIFYIILKIKIM